jgi:hypothetical protein
MRNPSYAQCTLLPEKKPAFVQDSPFGVAIVWDGGTAVNADAKASVPSEFTRADLHKLGFEVTERK